MTHTAHRSGELESLQNDFVFLMMSAKGFNDKEATPKFKKIRFAHNFKTILTHYLHLFRLFVYAEPFM